MLDFAELANWPEYVKLLAGLLALTDPIGNLPVYVGVVAGRTDSERRQVRSVAVITYIATLLLFTFLGGWLLNLFGITLSAFQIGGGVLLFLMALEMLRSQPDDGPAEDRSQASALSLGVFPVGIPLLAGPGAMSFVLIFANVHAGIAHDILIGGAVVTIAVLSHVILGLGERLEALLGPTGMTVFNRIMGLIVIAIAVEFMMDGIASHFLLPTIEGLHGG